MKYDGGGAADKGNTLQNSLKLVNKPSWEGIVPVNLLPNRSTDAVAKYEGMSNNEICGASKTNILQNLLNLVILPISDGIGPLNSLS
jgi:hypothetical protein